MSREGLIGERLRGLERGRCFCSKGLTDGGKGLVIVSRRLRGGKVCFCSYLIDTYCLGVMDAFWNLRVDEDLLDELGGAKGLRPCSYEEAHNWVYGAMAWADDAGIEPCRQWDLAQFFLDEDTDDVPMIDLPFGKDGRYFLLAEEPSELFRYLPTLREHLGEDFDYALADPQEGSALPDEVREMRQRVEPYTYTPPRFPDKVRLHYPEIRKVLMGEGERWFVSVENAIGLLALPHEGLREDLEALTMESLGRMYDGSLTEEEYATIENACTLLGEVGNEGSSLEVVLEVLRMPFDMYLEAISEFGSDTIVPTIIKLGRRRLDRLYGFMLEPGICHFMKSYVSVAVAEMAFQEPELRGEVVEWFGGLLREALKDATPAPIGIEAIGSMIADIVNLQAEELLPEIRLLFQQDKVDYTVCGKHILVEMDLAKGKTYRYPIEPDLMKRLHKLANPRV